MKILKKRLGLVVLVVTLFLLLALIFKLSGRSGKIEVIFLDVGQGDAALIKLPSNKKILIDGGPDNIILRRLGSNLSFFDRRIDLMVLSHAHDDHLLGLIEVINRYQVGTIIYMKGVDESNLFKTWLAAAKKSGAEVIPLESEARLEYFPGCFLTFFNPLAWGAKVDGNNSLVTKLNCLSATALFTGDNSARVEDLMMKKGVVLTAKILKAAHHGSKTANSQKFLEAVNPERLIISVGANNRFGHPSPEIIKILEKMGIKFNRTDYEGTIKIEFLSIF